MSRVAASDLDLHCLLTFYLWILGINSKKNNLLRLIISGKEDLAAVFPVYTEQLSRRLYKALESIEASTETRDSKCQVATSKEILVTTIFQFDNTVHRRCSSNASVHWSFYICGSTFEGTNTTGTGSDVDMVCVKDWQPVVKDISDASNNICFLMVQDLHTPPGYVKLQCVLDGVPVFLSSSVHIHGTAYDKECRAVLTEDLELEAGYHIHGPAISKPATETHRATDFVWAVRCRKIPDCASGWFSRLRHYNWPTAEWIDKCRTLGCFFVYVGHPESEEKHLQWRLSFSLQERFLVTQFNSVQLKCYILMKIINKDIIHKEVGEKSLTSYHCKTCLLYLIENSPAEFWREDNLLVCFHTYLSKIHKCVEKMNCPNYFVPDENMFNGRLHGEIQIKLQMVLRNILSADIQYFLKLQTLGLGRRFQHAIICSAQRCGLLSRLPGRKQGSMVVYLHSMVDYRDLIMRMPQSKHSDPAVSGKGLHRLKLRLQNTDTVTEHTREQTKKALSPVITYIDISLMSVMAVLAKTLHKSSAFILQILASEKWHLISLESDQFSSKLKQASLLYMMEFPEVSLDVLLTLERRLRHQLSVCAVCSDDRLSIHKFSNEEILSLEGNTTEEMLEKDLIPCVIYLPAEQDLTPPAICYEMNRSLGFPEANREDWYDCAIVDGKILLYFLLYLNHRHFGMEANAAADMENISWLIANERHLGHRETALNLLGWIYKESGRVDRAVECFRNSLTIQPSHNAAFWHLKDIESVLLVFLSSRFNVK